MCLQEEVEVRWLAHKAGDGAMKIFCLTFGKKRSGERIMCRIKQRYINTVGFKPVGFINRSELKLSGNLLDSVFINDRKATLG